MHCELRNRVAALERAPAAAVELAAAPEGACYRLGGDARVGTALAQVLPGGPDFVVCQPAGQWANTEELSGQLMPANAWTAVGEAEQAAAAPACTPLHGRPLEAHPMFDPAGAVVCAASMSLALCALGLSSHGTGATTGSALDRWLRSTGGRLVIP
jgi:hypothetical protein